MSVARPLKFHDVGAVEDFEIGKLTPLPIPGKDIWLLRTPDERYYALKNTCPHQGAPICRGTVDGTFVPSAPGVYEFGARYEIIRCPHHAFEFSLETGLPAYTGGGGRVVRYDVMVEDGRVQVSDKGK
jgi:3-phenylpropionate/trans-cinnamate dioxygenase ferredoxin subunit